MEDKRLAKLESEIARIKDRNLSVEADKAWETSYTRKILIAVFTYLAISIYMLFVHIGRPFLNAIVPTLGFILSTLTLSWFKVLWIKNRLKRG